MKHKAYKRIAALTLVLMLVLALSGTAFADATMGSSGTLGTTESSLDRTLNIPVKLKVYNPDENSVYAPNITYTFAVTAGSAGKTIQDSQSVKAVTKTTSVSPECTKTLSWSSATTKLGASSKGDNTTAANVQNLVLNFTNVNFGAAGVYRYTITETATYTGTGVTAGATGKTSDTVHTLYLDVYVKDSTAAGDTIYGYVLHTVDDDTTTNSNKVEGFEDEYYTSNLVISKSLVGDAAMNGHSFPFNVTFDASAITADFHLATDKTGTATVSNLGNKTYADTNAQIAKGDTIKYIGIPAGVTAEVYETNDVTGTSYKSEATSSQGNAATAKIITWEAGSNQSNTATMSASTADAAGATVTIAFTNTLELISPTGVVLRVAPYVCMLAAGIFLLTLSRRRRAAED